MNGNSITNTTSARSLKGFLDRALVLPSCFRCLATFTEEDNESGTFCQIQQHQKQPPQAVGGVLCAKCVEAWHEWRRVGAPVLYRGSRQ